MRYNEMGPAREALPYSESRALASDWWKLVAGTNKLGFSVWEEIENRGKLFKNVKKDG